MEVLQAVALGVTQGLTEFLPVSSSGHLVLLQNLLGIHEPELLLDISLHVGTLAAVFIAFRGEIWSILATVVCFPGRMKTAGGWRPLWQEDPDVRMIGLIVIGSAPTAVLGLLFKEIAEQLFGAVWIVGVMLLVTGTLLWLTRRAGNQGRKIGAATTRDALVVGLVQGLAIIPGISRSGSTISAALFLGIDRELAGRYSFLLSIPAILGAVWLGVDGSMGKSTLSAGAIAAGTLVSAIVGYAALTVLLRTVRKGYLYYFAPYCWVVGGIALVWDIAM